eukprot:TRINITY_DN22434_c0_g1_i3.p1 TRINITY_DN22434_c0_g1~~TRINITY_DN22434_c0_g1_i3.p1  ORF type:complete len:122 (+),score=6.38 TRINITY_DN22434_c0_g1_i3:151-516(+)
MDALSSCCLVGGDLIIELVIVILEFCGMQPVFSGWQFGPVYFPYCCCRDDPSEVPTPFFASLSASTLADCLTWENERLSFKTDSSTSSITFAKHRGGLHKPNTHRITKKESPSAIMLLRFN